MRVPLLNFEGSPGVLLTNFERGPGVPLLNFEGVPGPGSQGHEVSSRGPGPTFTPCPEKRCVENYCLFGKAQIFPYKSVEFQTSVNIKRIAYVYQKRDQKFIKKYFT